MCDFFSFVTDSRNRKYYFDWELRKQKEVFNPQGQSIDSFDSHSEICAYFDIDCDKVNKYEYNPLLKVLKTDQINIKDRTESAEVWVKKLDFKTIVEPLIIKKIVNPLRAKKTTVTKEHIELLKQWASVRDSVWDSVGASVWASVWASVRDSVGAYLSSFFQLDEWKDIEHEHGVNPFQPCIDLWAAGLVPSFDGKKWRLHSGKKAAIVYKQGEKDER